MWTAPRRRYSVITMIKLVLAAALARWIAPDGDSASAERTLALEAATVGEALNELYARHPQLRTYVVDDQGAIRAHIVLFIDGLPLRDKNALQQPLHTDSSVYVMQALSGG